MKEKSPYRHWEPTSLETRDYVLRPIGTSDIEALRVADVTLLGPTWRGRGLVRTPDEYARFIWNDTQLSLLGYRRQSKTPVGIFLLHGLDQLSGTAYVSSGRFHRGNLSPSFAALFVLFLDYSFSTLSLRKIYAEVAEYNMPSVEGLLGEAFLVEGRLSNHIRAGDEFFDLLLLALDRDRWMRFGTAKRVRSKQK